MKQTNEQTNSQTNGRDNKTHKPTTEYYGRPNERTSGCNKRISEQTAKQMEEEPSAREQMPAQTNDRFSYLKKKTAENRVHSVYRYLQLFYILSLWNEI